MFYTVGILFLFSAIILIKKYTNYYSIILCLQTFFLNIALIFLLISIAKIGNYTYPNNPFFLPDYSGYLMLSKIKISFYAATRMQNIGFAGFLACLPFFLYHPERKKKTVFLFCITLILPIFYVIFYDPMTRLEFLTLLYKSDSRVMAEKVLKVLNFFNYIWISAYMVVPLGRLLYASLHTKSMTKRKQLFSLFFTLLCLNLMCLFIFILGPSGQTYTTLSVDNLLCFPDSGSMHTYNYTYLPLLTLVLSNVMLILLFRFRGLDRVDFFRNMQISRMALKPNKNIRNILHTYKNEMLSVNMIARQLENIDDAERQKYLIHRLSVISENAISNVGKTMTNFKTDNIVSKSCNIVECIENALGKIIFDKNITIEKNYESNAVYAMCDKYRTESSLENILSNAQEAIRIANRTNGQITVSLESEFEWVFIRITDNGVGIPKKELKKIFNAFYSTKLSSNNWGIGLNYVFRSIRIMKGFVYAESEVNKYTTFTIMLQRSSHQTEKKETAQAVTK